MLKRLLTALAAMTAGALGQPLMAANILVNGDFEIISVDRSSIFGDEPTPASWGGTDVNRPVDNIRQEVLGWNTAGFNFVMKPGTIDTTGGVSPFAGNFTVWGSNNGGSAVITTSPTGGNFVAADAAYRVAPIFQELTDLVVGATYTLTFNWAAAQANPFGDGGDPTTEGWTVCFGTCDVHLAAPEDINPGDTYFLNGEVHSTATVTTPNKGFTPWMSETMTFTATSDTQKLSLLAYGTPLGQPPFSLIDSLNLDGPLQGTPPLPEPTTWMMLVLGFGVVGGVMRTRRPSFDGKRARKQLV